MLYIADSRPLSEIREAFDSRISPWSPGAKQWLCLVVRDRETRIPLGLTGYRHHEGGCAEVGFYLPRPRRGAAMAMNPCVRSVILPSVPEAYGV